MNSKNERKQLNGGIILSYLTEFVEIVIGLLYTPFMIATLGQSEYGLYQLVASVVSYLSLFGLGFSSSYQRFYAKEKNDKSGESNIAAMNGMFLVIFLIMSLVCIICGIFMIHNADIVLGKGLTATEIDKSRVLLGIMVFSMALTFPNSLFTGYIIAHQQFIFLKAINILQRLLSPCICLPLLLMGFGSVGITSISAFLTTAVLVANMYFCIKKLRFKVTVKRFQLSRFKEMWNFTFYIFLNQIVNQVNWSIDKILLGHFCNTTAIAIYSVGGQLRSYFSQFATTVSSVFVPKVNQIASTTNDNTKLSVLFAKVGQIQSYVIFLIVSGFYFFGKQFVLLWLGNGYDESYYLALMFFAVLCIPYMQNLGIEIQRAKNMHRMRSIVYTIIAVINIFFSIPLIKMFGVIGAGLGTVVSVFLGNIVFMNFYYWKYIKLDMAMFLKKILRVIPGLFIPLLFGIAINGFVLCNTWLKLFVCIGAYCIVYIMSMFLFGTDKETKSFVIKTIKRK